MAQRSLLVLLTALSLAATDDGETLPLLLPDATTHTKLVPQHEAIQWLSSLRGQPVVVISVVGAYRTGKSWLLNELMELPCTQGRAGRSRPNDLWVTAQPCLSLLP